ncbi:hypothetical protein JH06_1026 [Blastocystis sp. subtype 4]|uniref:hypothetical protein n=1 Tax=Blastocystis sp. subtype 4 TaxID=944170 RepID=UPI0007117081|nr:hypothetical protein JH06_1026 [Blastocystis sp. subtype 4]KNB45317.1 hypothetical protein JH06_1026 [Blastocystis sp. subtype 4]|eukprot:XP_014528760.1 hypothetical protein JH06_1026 [Blastocystis sp. subtype 4]
MRRKMEFEAELQSFRNIQMNVFPFPYPDEERKSALAIAYSGDGKLIATTHSSHEVLITNAQTGRLVHTFYRHPRTPWTVKWHPRDMNLCASGCLGSRLILWDTKSGSSYKDIVVGDKEIVTLDFHPSQDYLLFGCGDSVYIWDYQNSTVPQLIIQKKGYAIISTLFAGGGELLLIGSRRILNNQEFEDEGRIEEYLLTMEQNSFQVSKPLLITSTSYLVTDRCMSISNCGMFLLVAIEAQPKYMEPKYYSLSYGPAFDRDYLHLVSEEKKDLSQGRSFSRIMQQAINGTEGEVVVESSYQDDGNEQYGVSIAAKCDIGVGQVKKKLAVLSLDPETKGYVLEFINIRDDVSVVGVDFCKSNNFILLCTENNYPIYEENKKVFCAHIRVIQSSTWEIIYEKEFRNATPNSAVWSPNGCSFSCCLTNGDIVSFSPMLSLIVCSLHLNMNSLSPDEFCSKWIFVMTRT